MDENEVSFTSENTVQAKMQAILAGGLSEATMECLNNLINDYELWHDALAVKIPDAQRAFAYKKLVVGLSERISNQMEHKINYIETRSLMKGINLAQTDPIALLTKAANIVLNDSENLEAIKAIESGRAFNVGGGFDPRKRPPPGGQSEYNGREAKDPHHITRGLPRLRGETTHGLHQIRLRVSSLGRYQLGTLVHHPRRLQHMVTG